MKVRPATVMDLEPSRGFFIKLRRHHDVGGCTLGAEARPARSGCTHQRSSRPRDRQPISGPVLSISKTRPDTMVNTTGVPQMHRQDTDISNPPKKVAMLTAGGLAPCLSSAVGALITEYAVNHPSVEIICYVNGYKGLLLGESIDVTPGVRATASALHMHGGSPIGNSRVKLTNIKDCVKRGLVQEGQVSLGCRTLPMLGLSLPCPCRRRPALPHALPHALPQCSRAPRHSASLLSRTHNASRPTSLSKTASRYCTQSVATTRTWLKKGGEG